MALPKRYETVARLGWTSTTGDPDGELARRARCPPEPLALPTGRAPPAPARLLARSRSAAGARTRCARAGEAVELPEREVERHALRAALARRRPRRVRDRVLGSGTYVRSLDRRPRRRLLRGAAPHARSAPSTSPTPTRADRAARRRARLPARRSRLEGDDARRAAHGVAVAGRRPTAGGIVRLLDADGLIALAEPAAGRHAQARRRLPRLMKVTWLPDAEPRPRHVAVGEFDGVHLGHREVIARRRHRADLRAAPAHGRARPTPRRSC